MLEGLRVGVLEIVREAAAELFVLLEAARPMDELVTARLALDDRKAEDKELVPEHIPKADWQPSEGLQWLFVVPHQFCDEQQFPNSLSLHVRPPKLLPQRPLIEIGARETEGVDAIALNDVDLETRSVLL